MNNDCNFKVNSVLILQARKQKYFKITEKQKHCVNNHLSVT